MLYYRRCVVFDEEPLHFSKAMFFRIMAIPWVANVRLAMDLTSVISPAEVVGRAAVRMGQARARFSALQLAGSQKSARRVAIGLRGAKPEENRGPDYHLTATGEARKRRCDKERKSAGQFRLHCTSKTIPDPFSKFPAG
jgi:hypothetical protein